MVEALVPLEMEEMMIVSTTKPVVNYIFNVSSGVACIMAAWGLK